VRLGSTSLIALALVLGTAQAGAQSTSAEESADARWDRLQAERAAEAARQRDARERYEQGVREAAEARARYEADMARHAGEVERARAAQADYERQRADHDGRTSGEPTAQQRPNRDTARSERQRQREARDENQRCERRARRRGRLIGGLLGGVAGGIVAQNGGSAAQMVAISAPVSLLLGEAITRLLDCREREQAAAATERVIEQATAAPAAAPAPTQGAGQNDGAQRGSVTTAAVGQTVSWTSETRPGVSGSSTITGLEREAGGGECMTVTDIIIVDGQETRAPKRMCRRPPSQRFVRV